MISGDTVPTQMLDSATEAVRGALLEIWRASLSHLPQLLSGVVLLLVIWGVAHGTRGLVRRALRRTRLRRSLRELFGRLSHIAIWGLGLLSVAMVWFPGLTPTKALGGLGVLSVAVGFAFKDIFENFFAGILILWRFPFDNGDFVAVGDIEGRIEEITIRNTMIRKTTGELLVVPNSKLFVDPVEVLTNKKIRRLDVTCGIAYGEEVDEAVDVIRDAVESCDSVSTERDVDVFPCAFGDSSVDIEVAWWAGALPIDRRRSRAEVVTRIKAALDEAGIEIPFPHRTLTFKEPLSVEGRAPRGEGGEDPEATEAA